MRLIKGQKGQALPLAIAALAVGALIIAPFLGHVSAGIIGSRTYGSEISSRGAADAGVEHAIWELTYGTLAFSLTNPGDSVTYQLPDALNGVTTTVTVTANATGSSGARAVLDSLEFDAANGYTPDAIQVSSGVVAIAYRGSSNKGYVKTMSIDSAGAISAIIDSLNFEKSNCYEPDIVHVSGDIYAVAYRGGSNRGYIVTFSISAAGAIGNSTVDSLRYDNSAAYEPDIVQVSGMTFAIAYRGSGNRGYIKTVSISGTGAISNSVIDTFTLDSSAGYTPSITQVSGNIFAIAYRGASNRGILKTVNIASNGSMGTSPIATMTFDYYSCYEPVITQVANNIFAIAYRGWGNSGILATVYIAANGAIGSFPISTFTYDTASAYEPDIIPLGANNFAIAYHDAALDGWLTTVTIAGDGTITQSVADIFDFEPNTCYEPSVLQVTPDIIAIAYRGTGNHGFIVTIGAGSGGAAAYRIVATAGDTTIDALVNTENNTASIIAWQVR